MQLAERLNKITPSMTLAINARAQEMRKAGMPVISLAIGEPDFPTPQFVKDAGKKAIDDNFTHYTPVSGIKELRQAAAHYFERYYAVKLNYENLIIGAGGKQCLYSFIQTTINPDDEVLIPVPYWVSYPDMVLLAGAKPVFVESSISNGFKITPAELEKRMGNKTRLLILNTPCNPTGAVYSDTELEEIVKWCITHNIFLLADEIYDQLVYEPCHMASASPWLEKYPDYVAVVNGLSKSFAMTGWRAGFLAAHPMIIEKMSQLQSHSLGNISSITQMAALAALNGADVEVQNMREAFKNRRELALRMISEWDKAVCPKPDGAFYLFVDVSAYYNNMLTNSIEFSAWLLENAQVATVPGASFGNDSCIRLSFAVSEKTLATALQKIGNCLKNL